MARSTSYRRQLCRRPVSLARGADVPSTHGFHDSLRITTQFRGARRSVFASRKLIRFFGIRPDPRIAAGIAFAMPQNSKVFQDGGRRPLCARWGRPTQVGEHRVNLDQSADGRFWLGTFPGNLSHQPENVDSAVFSGVLLHSGQFLLRNQERGENFKKARGTGVKTPGRSRPVSPLDFESIQCRCRYRRPATSWSRKN